MGMGMGACFGWIIADEELAKICPEQYENLIKVLDDHDGGTFDSLARDFQMEEVDSENMKACHALRDAFTENTRVALDGGGNSDLFLILGYYDSSEGDRYDELDQDHYWEVIGMEMLTPAGEKIKNVELKTWTWYG